MRIETTPDNAKYATVGEEVEFERFDFGTWRARGVIMNTPMMQAMEAKFETDLEAPEGYRFADPERDKDYVGAYLLSNPPYTHWDEGNFSCGPFWVQGRIYAIPLKPKTPAVVEGISMTEYRICQLDGEIKPGTEVYVVDKARAKVYGPGDNSHATWKASDTVLIISGGG